MKNGWQAKTLDQISVNLDSQRIPITKAVRKSGDYPYYGASGIVDYVADYIFEGETLLVSEDGANLLARSTPIAFSASGKYWVNNHAHILKFDDRTTQQFVEHYLESIKLTDYVTGMAQPKLTQKALNSIPIPIPPLPEQRRIVGILDQAFNGIATAKANAEKNLHNSQELFNNHLHSVFLNGGNDWETKKLCDLAEYFIGLTYSPKNVSNKGTIVLRSSNVQNGKLDLSDIVRVDRPIRESLKVKAGDILMCSRNGSKRLVGKTTTLNDLPEDMTFGTFMTIIRSEHNSYLSWFFKSDAFREQIGVGENTMINQITKYMLDDISVRLPPVAERRGIIQRIGQLSAETQRLESLYQRKLAALDELKKSLLHQAFSGQL